MIMANLHRGVILCCWLICTATYSLITPFQRALHGHKWTGRLIESAFLSTTGLFADSARKSLEESSVFKFEKRKQQRDVVIVGGALAGLSTALYLSQMDPNRHITILDREEYGSKREATSALRSHAPPASFAAAGMLAPQSERLPPGPLLDLCVSSRRMYSDFCEMVETLAQDSGSEGEKFLFPNQFKSEDRGNDGLEPWSIGFVGSGGFLAPAFAGDSVATWSPPEAGGKAQWLDSTQIRELEPHLHPDVIGGWWFPDDASVDARRLTCSLRAACIATGVQILNGPQYEVSSLDLIDGKCRGVFLKTAKHRKGQRYIGANTVLIANGAWMRDLLPVPIEPHKGQSLALRMPANQPPLLRRVLFAQDTYIVPKADGRIIVGATVEAGSFDANVTPSGILHILTHAIQLVPGLGELPIEESWVGLRPTTPDKGPILGETPWDNVFVAGGYWRNGVLLAPKAGQLLASFIVMKSSANGVHRMNSFDEGLLDAFAWDRFTSPEKSAALTANIRYSSSMHPIHKRGKSSATIGAELGTYSTARASAEDRKKDRDALFGDDDTLFERAAQLGKEDIAAYDLGQETGVGKQDSFSNVSTNTAESLVVSDINGVTLPYDLEGAADALTVGIANDSNDAEDVRAAPTDVAAIYAKIRANQAKREVEMVTSANEEANRPDPGFRIYHVDSETGEEREVPPYTDPVDFLKSIGTTTEKAKDKYSETTYDGYQAIQEANSRQSRAEELDAMREARRRNRLDTGTIDESKIGAMPWEGKSFYEN